MRGKVYSQQDKEKVKQYILEGKSYNEITRILGVPKSTISTWFGKTIKRPLDKGAMLEHLANIRKLAKVAINKKWTKWRENEDKIVRENITRELPRYPFDNIGLYKSMLAMLYWAEGNRYVGGSELNFANTDPQLSLLFLTLLRKCYNINENNLRISLHLHYYHPIKKTKQFWSELLNIPQSQFYKIYIKKRSKTKKFRKNFMGICFIRYKKSSRLRREIIDLGKELQKIIINQNKMSP